MFEQVEAFHRPASVREAVRLLGSGKGRARIVAGGTDLVVAADSTIRALIDITHSGIAYIRQQGGACAIGAATTMAELDYASLVPDSSAVFLFWQATMPYLTHHGRWRGGYFPTGYCYYPPNIPGNQFTKKQIAAPEGHVIASFTYKTFSPFSEPSDSGVPSSPLLITPVRQKKYDTYSATLGGLWDQTVKHLETVDRLVVVGYSFPVTDARPLDLFRAALKATSGKIELEIVAPGVKDIVARIGEDAISHAKNFRTHDMTFEDYINILASEMPQMMKTAAEENEEVRKWVKMMYVMREASLHRAQQEGG